MSTAELDEITNGSDRETTKQTTFVPKKRERWEGIVKLKSSFLGLYKERYLVIDRDCMIFYKTNRTKVKAFLQDNKTEIVRIPLRNASVTMQIDNNQSSIIVTSSAKKHQIQIEDREAWLNGVTLAIERANTDYFTCLPEEMALSIFLQLNIEALGVIVAICKRFNEWCKKNFFWKSWFLLRNPHRVDIVDKDINFLNVTWKWLAMCKRINSLVGFAGKGCIGNCYGEFSNGTLNGRTITLYENAKYVGQCHNGLRDGKGFLSFKKGDRIEGEFKGGKLVYGSLITSNGNKYEGEFKNSKYDGRGILTKVNGKRYEGEFKNGSRNGKGVFTFPDGSKYEGEFKNGKYDGRGIYTNVKGSRYEGEFKNGKYDGFGIYTNVPKGYRYEGEFKNGKFHGKGLLVNKTKGGRYEGEFKHGWSDGKGIYISADGGRYHGDFKRGKYHGYGTYTKSNGSRYEGEFQHGKFDGKGTFLSTSGKRFEGLFKGGKRITSNLSHISELEIKEEEKESEEKVEIENEEDKNEEL